ncbi:MAG TPA: hypothetical protein VH396_15010 [Chitinophagaceae bacterium]|jgi:hypothetical protein
MNGDLHNILLHLHSAGRWLVLLLLVIAIFNSLVAGGRPFIKSDNRTGLWLTSVADLMFLIGLALWYFGPYGYEQIQNAGSMGAVMKDSTARFFAVEHITAMLIAVILIHIGKAQAKKPISDRAKHRRTVLYYLIALIIILVSIPWPFMQNGAGRGWY